MSVIERGDFAVAKVDASDDADALWAADPASDDEEDSDVEDESEEDDDSEPEEDDGSESEEDDDSEPEADAEPDADAGEEDAAGGEDAAEGDDESDDESESDDDDGAEEGDYAEDIPLEPHAILQADPVAEMLVVWLQDESGQPVPNARYRIEVGDDVREGTADESGCFEEPDVPPESTATLSWGPADADSDSSDGAFAYERQVYLDTDDTDDESITRKLSNLGYVGGTLEEALAAFQQDYDGDVSDVHSNGTSPRPVDTNQETA
jgi:hypothetical protein